MINPWHGARLLAVKQLIQTMIFQMAAADTSNPVLNGYTITRYPQGSCESMGHTRITDIQECIDAETKLPGLPPRNYFFDIGNNQYHHPGGMPIYCSYGSYSGLQQLLFNQPDGDTPISVQKNAENWQDSMSRYGGVCKTSLSLYNPIHSLTVSITSGTVYARPVSVPCVSTDVIVSSVSMCLSSASEIIPGAFMAHAYPTHEPGEVIGCSVDSTNTKNVTFNPAPSIGSGNTSSSVRGAICVNHIFADSACFTTGATLSNAPALTSPRGTCARVQPRDTVCQPSCVEGAQLTKNASCSALATLEPGTCLCSTFNTSADINAGSCMPCAGCSPGRFVHQPWRISDGISFCSVCQRCQDGTGSVSWNTHGCTTCTPGRFSSELTGGACTDCQEGRYQPSTGSNICTACGKGHYNTGTGNTECSTCPPGKFNDNPVSGSCTKCPQGRYQPSTGSNICTPCGKGHYNTGTGNTECATCPPGKFNDNPVSGSCTKCPQGRYQPSTGSDTCVPCGEGRYSNGTGNLECAVCTSGKFANSPTSGVCTSCPNGRYQSSIGGSVCIACEKGKYAADSGSTACLSCMAGKYATYSASTTCTDCQEGYDQPFAGNTTCMPCGPGRYSIGMGNAECSVCPPGKFNDKLNSGMCMDCPRGQSASLPGSIACVTCSYGTVSNINGTGSTSCVKCPSGRFQLLHSNGDTCIKCPIGKHTDGKDGWPIPSVIADLKAANLINISGAYVFDLQRQSQLMLSRVPCEFCPEGKYGKAEGEAHCNDVGFSQYVCGPRFVRDIMFFECGTGAIVDNVASCIGEFWTMFGFFRFINDSNQCVSSLIALVVIILVCSLPLLSRRETREIFWFVYIKLPWRIMLTALFLFIFAVGVSASTVVFLLVIVTGMEINCIESKLTVTGEMQSDLTVCVILWDAIGHIVNGDVSSFCRVLGSTWTYTTTTAYILSTWLHQKGAASIPVCIIMRAIFVPFLLMVYSFVFFIWSVTDALNKIQFAVSVKNGDTLEYLTTHSNQPDVNEKYNFWESLHMCMWRIWEPRALFHEMISLTKATSQYYLHAAGCLPLNYAPPPLRNNTQEFRV